MENREDEPTLTVVEAAARVAAAKALDSPEARKRDIRVILLSCCTSVLLVVMIALPVVLWLDYERRTAALERARFNCDQQAETVAILEKDLEGGIRLREESRKLAQDPKIQLVFYRLFGREVVEGYYAKLAALESARLREWRDDLLPRLRQLAATECDRVLVTEGVKTTPRAPSRTSTTHTTPAK